MFFNLDIYGNNIALKDDMGTMLSYEELASEGKTLCSMISGRCLVFCMCSNTIGSVIGYTAFLNHDIVPVMLNSQIDDALLSNLFQIYLPAYVWAPKESIKGFSAIYSAYDYVLYETGYGSRYSLYDDLALLLTTSGSTGSPKFVRQSYNNILSNTQSIIEYLNINSDERPITTLPMNYTYGLSIINTHIWQGAEILLTEKSLMQKEFWRFFIEESATSFGGVPYTYEMLKKLKFFKKELPDLKTMTQAGGKLSPDLHEEFARYAAERGIDFVVMYGQCEATARMAYLPANKAVEKKGSMGIAIPGGLFRLIDTDGTEIKEPYVKGELVYEGKNVTLGYAQNGDDLARGDERRGVLETGDIAEFDEDGYYYIVGRKKRFLKIYGNRVNLDEMERLLSTEYSFGFACGGVDDHLYIFSEKKGVEDAIRSFIAKKTGLNTAAFKVVWISVIPRNDAGKILYKELEKYYAV